MTTKAHALPSFLTALLCGLLCYGALVWTQAYGESERLQQQQLHVQLFLRSVYELHGAWTSAEPALADSPLIRDYRISLWTATGERVLPSLDEENRERRTLLHEGQIIGSYAATFPDAPAASASWRLLLALALGLTSGTAVWYVLRRQGAAYDRNIQHIAHSLYSAPSPALSNGNPSELSTGDIHTAIVQLHERLERLETVRKSMVADIAHELRTPLTVLRAKLERSLQLQVPLPPEELVPLQDEVYRMSKLLQDLQQLALAESGHLVLDKRWFPVRPMLEELADLIQLEAEASGVELSCQFKHTALIYADENRLRQVLLNLLGNALRHARTTVVLSAACTELACEIEIIDDGMGIEPEELPRLFDRFYRGSRHAPAQSASPQPGLGLGLAIAKGLTEAHGGSIEIESQWGQGTTFRVRLPVFKES